MKVARDLPKEVKDNGNVRLGDGAPIFTSK